MNNPFPDSNIGEIMLSVVQAAGKPLLAEVFFERVLRLAEMNDVTVDEVCKYCNVNPKALVSVDKSVVNKNVIRLVSVNKEESLG